MLVVLAGNLLTRGEEGEMGDFLVFWVCFMVEREREEKVVNSGEKGGAGGCGDVEMWRQGGNKRRKGKKRILVIKFK